MRKLLQALPERLNSVADIDKPEWIGATIMEPPTVRNLLRQPFLASARAEKDLNFRATILRRTKSSMIGVGIIGLIIPLIYVIALLFLRDQTVFIFSAPSESANTVMLWDKILMMMLGGASIILSRTHGGRRWGRLIIGIIIVSACLATLSDDLARGDLSLSAAWLALIMFVSLTAPYRAWQTLTIGACVIIVFVLGVPILPALAGWEPAVVRAEHVIFLVLVALACAIISGVLYGGLYNQYRSQLLLATANRKLRETQAQLVQSAKMASLGSLVAGVAHEINNPLGVIHSNTNLALRAAEKVRSCLAANPSGPDGEIERSLGFVVDTSSATLEASDRINAVIRALRNFARLDEADRKEVDIHEGIESVLTILPQFPQKKIRIVKTFGQLPSVTCFPGQFNQVVMNLVQNAIEAIAEEGTITISTGIEGDWVVLRVADDGRGVPPDEKAKVFDPGYTTKGVGVGTGLGLPICYRIVENHGGQIDLSSSPGEGTVVTVRLPAQG